MKQIIGSVFRQNHEGMYCAPQKPINCDEATVIGIEWQVPDIMNGMLQSYRNVKTQGDVKPTPDSVKTIRVQTAGQHYWIVIADNVGLGAFANACNECCENGTPVIAAPALPTLIIEDSICADQDGNFRTGANIPIIVSGQKIFLELFTCNGTAGTPTPPSQGFANNAALLAWVVANYDDYGTWSLVNSTVVGDTTQTLQLVSATCNSTSLQVTMLRQKWCGDVTYPVNYNKIIHNGVTTNIDSITANNATELITQIANYFADGLITAPTSGKLQYDGTGAPNKLQLTNTNKVTFTAGACVIPTTTTTTAAPTTTTTTIP